MIRVAWSIDLVESITRKKRVSPKRLSRKKVVHEGIVVANEQTARILD